MWSEATVDLGLRCTALAQRSLRRLDRALEQLKMELILRQKILTWEQLHASLEKAGWMVKSNGEGPYVKNVVLDVETTDSFFMLKPQAVLERTFIMPPPPPDGDECEECGARIPDEAGGSIVNTHHEVTCSLYDDHISSNSGC